MAAAEKELQFESFLKKRKDTLKFTWSKYLFRLRNTTLSFYTSKEADEACLRGKYYIHLVQSVREVKATESNYTFEILMKNGKRKLLSADTAELRKIWIEYLWKSMQLPSPGRKNSSCTWHDLPSLEQRAKADVLNKPDSRSELEDSTYEQLSSRSDGLVVGNKNNSGHGDSSGSNVPQLQSDEEVTRGDAEQENESCDSEETNIYDFPKLRSEGECTNPSGFEEKSNEEPEHFDLYDIPNPENILIMAKSEEESKEEPEHFDIHDIPNPESTLIMTKSEEKCNEEPEHFDLYDIPSLEDTLITKSGEAIDDIGEQWTASDYWPLDELQGVSNV